MDKMDAASHIQHIAIIGVGMVGEPLARFFREERGFKRGDNLFLFDTDPRKGYDDDPNRGDAVFISVPTPRQPDGSAGLGAVESAIARITVPRIIVIKSTVPPGTTEMFQKKYPQHRFVFNPEFLTEAHAWEDTVHPDRQLVGSASGSEEAAAAVLALLPDSPIKAPAPGYVLSSTEAEIIKYGANVFLARKVTFANAMYDVAIKHGADYERIRRGIAADERIGPSHLEIWHQGYRGYGGYCFVKDTDALIAHCKSQGLGAAAALIEADRDFNMGILASQGLTPEDVSMHDHEWISKKLESGMRNQESGVTAERKKDRVHNS